MRMNAIKPTLEQHNALAATANGDTLKIMAHADAGKTATLRMIAERLGNKRGNYLAFSAPSGCECACLT